MNCLFPALNTCDSGGTGDDHDSANERKSRSGYFWRQDGMLQEAVRRRADCDSDRKQRLRSKSRENSERSGVRKCIGAAYVREADSFITRDTRDTRDDVTTASYMSSRYDLSTVVGSDDTTMYPTESDSRTSVGSEWTEKTAGINNTKKSSFTWLQSSNNILNRTSKGQQQQYNHYQPQPQPHPRNNNVSSPTNSVGAVRRVKGDNNKTTSKVVSSYSSNAFDYIRKNRKPFFQKPCHDPPSDKSMATSRSIRAADAGSVFFKKNGAALQRRKSELARLILKRRQMGLIQAGQQP